MPAGARHQPSCCRAWQVESTSSDHRGPDRPAGGWGSTLHLDTPMGLFLVLASSSSPLKTRRRGHQKPELGKGGLA